MSAVISCFTLFFSNAILGEKQAVTGPLLLSGKRPKPNRMGEGGVKMKEETAAQVSELLAGAYDLHVHTSPSVFPRMEDGFELVQEA
ncbi:MAG: hypothetical protein HFF33_11165, partial [Oscillospiraceae bacterium]|nr:hypothetical protein [Oscillospiraceae bacterium]